MFDLNIRLISMLGLLTVVTVTGLTLDYLQILRRPVRLGFWVAILGIVIGFVLTVYAVLPGNDFYGAVFSRISTKEKVVALTFDDGPYPPYTGQILDILREYKVPATFFVIGRNAEKHPELVRRILAEGHQLGNHTYDHVDLLKADKKTIAYEIDRANKVIAAITGQVPHVVRPPHGFRDPVVMEVMNERHLKVVEWSVMSRDWTNPGVDVIVSRTLKGVKNGSIILLHDGDGIEASQSRAQTVEAVRRIITELLLRGYTFVTVDEILAKTGD
ncbi:polysaccharide deacetylase [Lucifera butyrica]|uniref:Polysaccharide deacetylase n=1 Tax=Lucifera butyrica TaxID=1351585 RepID=A0A498R8T3_9FIRM|nr:polysaccharide deacetylase family protein [Lucifera butyrica]VBB06553.1 polysaccharide deacetylase [Lucifera butyrica]